MPNSKLEMKRGFQYTQNTWKWQEMFFLINKTQISVILSIHCYKRIPTIYVSISKSIKWSTQSSHQNYLMLAWAASLVLDNHLCSCPCAPEFLQPSRSPRHKQLRPQPFVIAQYTVAPNHLEKFIKSDIIILYQAFPAAFVGN